MDDWQKIAQILDIAGKATTTTTLFVFLFGAFRGWWVPGYIYKQKCVEMDRQTTLAEQAVAMAERLASSSSVVNSAAKRGH